MSVIKVMPWVFVIALAGCSEKPADVAPAQSATPSVAASAPGVRKNIYVAAQQVPCVGVAPMQCLQVREQEDQPWQLAYFGIEGFEFRQGVESHLQIIETRVENPPADGSSVRWVLEKILDQKAMSPAKKAP